MGVDCYAVTKSGWRAISDASEVKEGETLHTGEPPVVIAADNALLRANLMNLSSDAISRLQDSVDFEMATDVEKSLLLEWRRYRILLGRVDISAENPEWPQQP